MIIGLFPFIALAGSLALVPADDETIATWYVRGWLLWGVFIVGLTEGLSLVKGLTFTGLLISWLVIIACMIAFSMVYRQQVKRRWQTLVARLRSLPRMLLVALALVAGTLLVIALLSPPNYWDALTYHMSRVMHWQVQHSVCHYVVNDTRQVVMPPFSEYLILHLQVLTGGDSLANLVQWFSWLGLLPIVGLIAQELGARREGQMAATVLAAALPAGILQATSVQNDLVVALWLACFVFLILRYRDQHDLPTLCFIGAALGLAILSKATAYIYALPFALWFGIYQLIRHRSQVIKIGVTLIAVVLAINAGLYSRNLTWYGSPLGANSDVEGSSNQVFGIGVVVSNTIRNTSMHFGLNEPLTAQLTEGIRTGLEAIGINPDDPNTTKLGLHYAIPPSSTHESLAGNLLHMLAAIVTLILIGSVPSLRRNRLALLYGGLLVAVWLLFAAYLRWTLVRHRLHIPWFMLFTPLTALSLEKSLRTASVRILASGFLLASLPFLLANNLRPLIAPSGIVWNESILVSSRHEEYYNEIQGRVLMPIIEEGADRIAATDCRVVGLYSGVESFEYLLWMELRRRDKDFRLESVEDDRVPDTVCALAYQEESGIDAQEHQWYIRGTVLFATDYLTLTYLDD